MANYNRQARRAAHCIRARRRRSRKLAISPRRIARAAHGAELARVAARMADELELSAELIDVLLSLARPATSASVESQVRAIA